MSLTGRGRIFVAIGVISLATGLATGVVDLARVGVLLLVLPLASWLLVRRRRARLSIDHEVLPSRVAVGDRAEARLTLSNPHPVGAGRLRVTDELPGGETVRFLVDGVRARQQHTVSYPLPDLRRGRHIIGPASVVAGDPFGLVAAESRSDDVAELIVRPRLAALQPLPLPTTWRDGANALSHSIGAGGSDDSSVREFRQGDDLRKIHWRSTARAGTVMVRQEEQPWHGESLVLLDTRASGYRPDARGESAAFEWAVAAAASISGHLAGGGRRVTAVTAAGHAEHEPAAIADLMAEATASSGPGLGPLVAALGGLGQASPVFAVLSADAGDAVADLVAHPQPAGAAVALLLRPAGWSEQGQQDQDEQAMAASMAAWQSCAAALRAAGWRVVAADATSRLGDLWPAMVGARSAARP